MLKGFKDFIRRGNVIDLREEDDDFNAREDLGITLEARPNAAATIDAI